LPVNGVSEEWLSHLHAPIGFDPAGNEPTELALSIAAELVAVQHSGYRSSDGRAPPDHDGGRAIGRVRSVCQEEQILAAARLRTASSPSG
jgi:hypothetical protein